MDASDLPARPQAPAIDATDRETLEDRIEHLVLALEHRTVIGQATGILMERYQLTSHAAFKTLLRVSSEKNRKVHDLAQELVASGQVEGL